MHRIRSIPSTALATLLAALALLPLLGHKPLTDWDEAIYAEVSREMLRACWLVPHWNYRLWLEKPPLMLWITAIFFKLFGVTEFWARAASALSGVAIVGLLHGWLVRSRDTLAAWLSTAILLATFGFLHACHTGEMDLLLSLGCVIGVLGLAQIDEANADGWWFFWIGFAAAVMTKGAAAVVLPVTAIVFAAIQRWRADRLRAPFYLGLALFLAIVLPWHLTMFRLFGGQFLNQYFGFHVLARATRQIEGHTTPWWFYFKVLLVSAPPFSLIYPFALANGLRHSKLRAWAVFSLVVIAFYTAVQTRLPQYVVPAYPALSVLSAVWLADRLRPMLAARRPSGFWVKLGLAVSAIAIASVWATTPARKSLHSATLADGTTLPDNKDSIALLRDASRRPLPPVTGPLLLWRSGRISSIATDVFYSRRQVQQVELTLPPPGTPTDPYTFDPKRLDQAVTTQPQLILLDRSLLPSLPAEFTYSPIDSYGTMELGITARR
jgi:4-amino-4-deoxy-L-arabinose transferase-like glycosyltransferase